MANDYNFLNCAYEPSSKEKKQRAFEDYARKYSRGFTKQELAIQYLQMTHNKNVVLFLLIVVMLMLVAVFYSK